MLVDPKAVARPNEDCWGIAKRIPFGVRTSAWGACTARDLFSNMNTEHSITVKSSQMIYWRMAIVNEHSIWCMYNVQGRVFDVKLINENTPYYEQAVYFAMEQVRRTEGVIQLRIGRHDFYYLPEIELGLFLRLCRYSTEQGVTSRNVHPHDLTNGLLATSTITVQAACGAFLTEYPKATLACGIGSRLHEQAMFVKNKAGTRKKEMRVYNCNWYSSSVALVAQFRRLCNVETFVYHSALHRRQNCSDRGICGA